MLSTVVKLIVASLLGIVSFQVIRACRIQNSKPITPENFRRMANDALKNSKVQSDIFKAARERREFVFVSSPNHDSRFKLTSAGGELMVEVGDSDVINQFPVKYCSVAVKVSDRSKENSFSLVYFTGPVYVNRGTPMVVNQWRNHVDSVSNNPQNLVGKLKLVYVGTNNGQPVFAEVGTIARVVENANGELEIIMSSTGLNSGDSENLHEGRRPMGSIKMGLKWE